MKKTNIAIFFVLMTLSLNALPDYINDDQLVANEFARCSAYYFLRYYRENDEKAKEKYLNILNMNFVFSVAYSNHEHAIKVSMNQVAQISREASGMDDAAFMDYGDNITAGCASVYLSKSEELKRRGLLP